MSNEHLKLESTFALELQFKHAAAHVHSIVTCTRVLKRTHTHSMRVFY